MRLRKQQLGFAAAELLLVVVILALVGFVGWWVYQKHNTTDASTATVTPSATTQQSPVATNVSTAPQVKSTSDLDSALNTLNANDPSSANTGDSSQLDTQSNF